MGEDLRPRWWTGVLNGNPIGYGTRRGKTKTHVSVSTPTGPAAFRWTALCGSVMPAMVISSETDIHDEGACRQMLTSRSTHGPHQLRKLIAKPPAVSRLPWCPQCLEIAKRVVRCYR